MDEIQVWLREWFDPHFGKSIKIIFQFSLHREVWCSTTTPSIYNRHVLTPLVRSEDEVLIATVKIPIDRSVYDHYTMVYGEKFAEGLRYAEEQATEGRD